MSMMDRQLLGEEEEQEVQFYLYVVMEYIPNQTLRKYMDVDCKDYTFGKPLLLHFIKGLMEGL